MNTDLTLLCLIFMIITIYLYYHSSRISISRMTCVNCASVPDSGNLLVPAAVVGIGYRQFQSCSALKTIAFASGSPVRL